MPSGCVSNLIPPVTSTMNALIIPFAAIECVIFGFDLKKLNVLLTRPDDHPNQGFAGTMTLPGEYIREGEFIEEAASRLVSELTGYQGVFVQQFQSLITKPHLSPHLPILSGFDTMDSPSKLISIVHFALINLSNHPPPRVTRRHRTFWTPVDRLPALIPGHAMLVQKAFSILRSEIMQKPLAFELLPLKFTLSQMQSLYEEVLGIKFDKRNFRRKMMQNNYVIPIIEKQTNVAHKPARLYMFSRDMYERHQPFA